jgi:hypothetical protein
MLAFNKITCKNIGKYIEQKNLNRITGTGLFIPQTCPIGSFAFKMVGYRLSPEDSHCHQNLARTT